MSRSQGAGRAWCQADEGRSRVPAPWPPTAMSTARPGAGSAMLLCTPVHTTRLPRGAPPGGPPPARPPTDQPVLVPVPPRGSSAAHLGGHPAAWESWASPGEGHPPDTTALPTRGHRLRVWACQVQQDIPALPTRVTCTKSHSRETPFPSEHVSSQGRQKRGLTLVSASWTPSCSGHGPARPQDLAPGMVGGHVRQSIRQATASTSLWGEEAH